VGAGISGLSLAQMLDETCTVYEQADHVGGHCSSVEMNGCTFDQGPHIMFSEHSDVLTWMTSRLGDNVGKGTRRNVIWRKGRQHPWPERDGSEYTKKLWKVPLDELDLPAVSRIKDARYAVQEHFYYPKTGGYQALCEVLSLGVKLALSHPIEFHAWDKRDGTLVWTGPYNTVADFYGEPHLPVNYVTVVTEAVDAPGPDLTAVYLPEAEYLYNRLSYPHAFAAANCPSGIHLVQGEITHREPHPPPLPDQEGLWRHVATFPAYPVPVRGWREKRDRTKARAAADGIVLHGRFAEHEYWNADQCVHASMKLAARLNGW